MYLTEIEEILEAQRGNEEVLGKILQKNNGLIWSIIKRFTGRGYEVDDLYQIGCIGFIKAIQRFDTKFDVKISTYAVPYILGEIKRFLRDDGPIKISRSTKELAGKIREIQSRYWNDKGEEITIGEIAKQLKTTKEEVAMALESMNPLTSINEEAYGEENSGESKINFIRNDVDEAEKIVNHLAIREFIQDLEERERKIILLRYYQEKTQTEVAKMLGISQVQVSRMEKKILLAMREKIS